MTEDAMIERAAREEQDELDRSHGQHILDITADRDNAGDRLAEALRRAYQSKTEADEQ
jgi:hypothetical protein